MNLTPWVASAALRRFVVRSLVALFLLAGAVGPVGLPVARAADSHQAAIIATKQEIAATKTELDAARSELRQLQANKPKPPAKGASVADTKAYNTALANWQAKVDALQARITSLQNRLKDLEQKLRSLGGQKSEGSSGGAKSG